MVSINRKEFFQKIGILTGTLLTMPLSNVFAGFKSDKSLSKDKKQFLLEYQQWLTDFHRFVEKRNQNPFDIENNKRLMELSAQADKRKPVLEKHMNDPIFVDYFNKLTNEVTQSIES